MKATVSAGKLNAALCGFARIRDFALLPLENTMTGTAPHFAGFDGLRLVAAWCVIFSHAFLIATGTENDEPLVRLLGPGNIVGVYGVYTFFIISGFLLARSLAHDPRAVNFAVNRALRIFPGFIFCVVVTAFVLGPIGSSLRWSRYVAEAGVLDYVTTTLSCLCPDGGLPGVYAYPGSGNLPTIVNGSLWSLSYEVLSYLLLLWLSIVLRNIKIVAIVLVPLAVAAVNIPEVYVILPRVAYTLPYFAGGVAMYVVYQQVGLKPFPALGCALLLLAFAAFGWQRSAYAFFGAYIIVFLGSRPNLASSLAARTGDLSYGVYLFGWPVEQLVKQYTHTASPWVLMVLSAPLVLALAAASCHMIERPALRLKRPITSFIRRMITVHDPLMERATRSAATLTFLVATAVVLTSYGRSWLVVGSIAEIIGWSAIAAILALVGVVARRMWRSRFCRDSGTVLLTPPRSDSVAD